VYYYGEPIDDKQWITFGCIWLALVIFSGEGLYHRSQRKEPEKRLQDA
jgi:EamA domain-containing membrane protein RarD